ncbi:MAG: diaminopimelate decarboxylase, partial [Phycisphaerae bacterium]|nr:diaminopimelate decarboxylase [Phycisphaerae bacterium]
MDYFDYKDGQLFCEDVPVERIAAEAGTPVYIYSAATLLHHYRKIVAAFAELDTLVCFSVKSLSNVNILKLLVEEDAGFDIVSGGELHRVQQAGGNMAKVVFAGVGKTDAELRSAIAAQIGYFNVESEAEFENLARLAAEAGATVRAALRVNPDVDPKTHRYTTTGKKENKFGVDIERAERFFETFGHDANARLDAIHFHLGSPIYSAEPYVEAIGKTMSLIDRLKSKGFEINALDIGGGFAADYKEGSSMSAADYAGEIIPLLKGRELQLILEPGRQISANSGILLTRVQYVKDGFDRKFIISDAAMTDLIRPAMYGGEHFVWPANSDEPPRRSPDYAPDGTTLADVVGGVCESADFLAKDRMLPQIVRGDLM